MQEVLISSQPPSLDFFKTLLKLPGKLWGIYGITLEVGGCKPKLYVGSGTAADYGVSNRLEHYVPDKPLLLQLVRKAFRQGYHVSHRGLLCWTPLPSAGLVPRV